MITHALQGHIDWSFAIPLAIGVIPGAWIGANLTIGSPNAELQRARSRPRSASSAAVYAVEELYRVAQFLSTRANTASSMAASAGR